MIHLVDGDDRKTGVRQVVLAELKDSSGQEYVPYFERMGFAVLVNKRVGAYEGDFLIVLHEPSIGKFGFNTIGYGSCSGCDALLSHESNCIGYDLDNEEYFVKEEGESVDNFVDYMWRTFQRFQWYDECEDLVEYLKECDWGAKHMAYSMTESEEAKSGYVEIDEIINQLNDHFISST